jgi:hypothetical protein
MKHFTAQIIYRILCEGNFTEQYEEQWRLILAINERLALDEAKKIGAADAQSFVDRHGRMIEWQLIAVKDLQECEWQNGTLLFSTIKEMQPIAEPIWSSETTAS